MLAVRGAGMSAAEPPRGRLYTARACGLSGCCCCCWALLLEGALKPPAAVAATDWLAPRRQCLLLQTVGRACCCCCCWRLCCLLGCRRLACAMLAPLRKQELLAIMLLLFQAGRQARRHGVLWLGQRCPCGCPESWLMRVVLALAVWVHKVSGGRPELLVVSTRVSCCVRVHPCQQPLRVCGATAGRGP